MRRIQEIRKNEPDREIVHTDETWLRMQATESRRRGLTWNHCKIPVVLLLIMEPLVARRI